MCTIIYSLFLTLSLVACNNEAIGGMTAITTSNTASQESKATEATAKPITELSPELSSELTTSTVTKSETDTDNSVHQIQIAVGNQTFHAVLYKNETTDALMERLPLTIDMGELNGNEKFYYFPHSLPVNSERPSEIHAGDLMLYGSDCLVLFYESFSSSFSYTVLGYVEDSAALAIALGNGDVRVSFDVE